MGAVAEGVAGVGGAGSSIGGEGASIISVDGRREGKREMVVERREWEGLRLKEPVLTHLRTFPDLITYA